MEYSVEQAKSIFDLIKSVSPYSMPLIISLIFPIFWILLKKVLGIAKSEEQTTTSSSSNYFGKAIQKLRSLLSLNGEYSDKLVLYSCILLFIIGGILLKFGEKNEEKIRQRALELKKHFEIYNNLGTEISTLKKDGFDESILRKIRFNYPNDFVAYDSQKYLAIVDTITVKKIKKYVYSFLESYLSANFENRSQIYVDSLTTNKGNSDLKRYFETWIVYCFLSEQLNKEKYYLYVIDGRTVIKKITKNKSLPPSSR